MNDETVVVKGMFGDQKITRKQFITQWVEHAGQLYNISWGQEWQAIINKLLINVRLECSEEFDRLLAEQAIKKTV